MSSLRRPRFLAASSGSGASSISSNIGDGSMLSSVGGSGARTNSSGDTCAYYGLEPGESCRQPRSCYDCLNVPVANDPEGCLLSQFGVCESMTDYDESLDYRSSGSNADSGSATNFTGGWYHMFPAVNTTYCEDSDAACVKCNAIARNYSAEGNYIAMTTKFCVGETGCVCILSCEESVWKLRTVTDCEDLTVDSTASSAASTSSTPLTASPTIGIRTDSSSSGNSRNLFWLFTIPLVMLVFYGHYVRLRGVVARRRRDLETPQRSPRHRLRLSGWRALNEALMEKEKQPGASTSRPIEPVAGAQ